MLCNVSLLVRTMIFLPICYVLDLHAVLALSHLGSISSALPPGIERQPMRAHSSAVLRKFVQLANTTVPPFTPSPPNGKKSS